jgi:hypothetical protein
MKHFFGIALFLLGTQLINAQSFTRKDSLKGGLSFERTCFDVLRYDLNIKVNPDERSIVGYNKITFKVVANTSKIQLDLSKTINSYYHGLLQLN